MNERIKELLLESGFPKFYATVDGEELEKFAELIVRDCLDLCASHATVDGTASKIEESIREHFGVE